jgi:hypothetical protein
VSLNGKSNLIKGQERPEHISWADLTLAALASAAIFIYAHFQALTNPYVINDDVRQQLFWMQRWQDPELFRGDLLADYASHYVSWGVNGLYWLASWIVGPITFSKVLPGLLFVLLGCGLFCLGETLGRRRRMGWLTVGVFWLMPFFLGNMSGGLARAFAAPLLALFWLCWLHQRPWGMAVVLLLQALFIPYVFMLATAAVILAWAAGRVGLGDPPPFPVTPAHLVIIIFGTMLVFLMNQQFNAAGYGPLVSAAEMAHRPEFTAQGRFAILPQPPLLLELIRPWEFIAPFRETGLVAGGLACAGLVGLAAYGGVRLDWRSLKPRLQPVWCLILASLALFILARVFLFKLFVPDRYLIYNLNLCYAVFLALCWGTALRVERWPRVLVVAALVMMAALGGLRLKNLEIYDYSAYRPLYAALAQTPKDALIAGHPYLMDTVPTFARRRAFATFELAQPWSRGYWQQIKPRLEESFAAYYAQDPEEVMAFCRRHGISFLVVDDRHFTPAFLAGGWGFHPFNRPPDQPRESRLAEMVRCPFFAPFDDLIRRQTLNQRHFALLASDAFPALVVDQHLRLLDMRGYGQGKVPASHEDCL